MAFVRVSRDKRGYEHIYLIDATARRGKASRPRVLYWFRTPPGVMVGREPFDESVRRTLEAQYPDVTFDWEKLRKTAIPEPTSSPAGAAPCGRAAKRRANRRARRKSRRPHGTTRVPSSDVSDASSVAARRDFEADGLPDSRASDRWRERFGTHLQNLLSRDLETLSLRTL